MNESWKDIEEYEGLYMVSDLGRVKSLGNDKTRKERILKPRGNNHGYLLLKLCKDGNAKSFTVQRLVANAFIPNPENKPEVGHKDDNKTNNSVANLYWTDHKSNCNYGTRNEKISESLIGVNVNRKDLSNKILCVETNTVYPSAMEAERQTGINHSSIIQCCQGKCKSAGKLHWQYAELTNFSSNSR